MSKFKLPKSLTNKVNKLQGFNVFYKNEFDDGIGLTTLGTRSAEQMKNGVLQMHEACMREVKRIGKKRMIMDLKSQLENELIPLVKGNSHLSGTEAFEEARFLIYADIYSLEKLGGMPTDEYNGVQFQYGTETMRDELAEKMANKFSKFVF